MSMFSRQRLDHRIQVVVFPQLAVVVVYIQQLELNGDETGLHGVLVILLCRGSVSMPATVFDSKLPAIRIG